MSPTNTEQIETLLRRIEYAEHRRGWDQLSALYVIYDNTDPTARTEFAQAFPSSTPIQAGPYAARASRMWPDLQNGEGPAVLLHAIASAIGGVPRSLATLVAATTLLVCAKRNGFVGLAVVFEGWMMTGVDGDARREAEDATRGPLGVADMPGAVEFRAASAALENGGAVSVYRRRGQAPTVQPWGEEEGVIPESLALIVNAFAGRPVRPPDFVPVTRPGRHRP